MTDYYASERAEGWLHFAMTMIAIAAILNIIDGLAAILNSTMFDSQAHVMFDSLKTWGWVVLILGVVGFAVIVGIQAGAAWARWLGVGLAAISAIGHLMWVQANPWWSIVVIAIDVFIIYALTVYGGRRLEA